jgi:hypothetical protein
MNNIPRRKFLFTTFIAATGSFVAKGGYPNYRIYNGDSFNKMPPTKNVIPVIGAWFPQEIEMKEPDGYLAFLDAAGEHSHYTIITTSIRNHNRQMVDPVVHDWFKVAAVYAKKKGLGLALEVDARHSIPAFKKKYPDALQQRLWLNEIELNKGEEVKTEIVYSETHGDAICPATTIDIHLERVYSYSRSLSGQVMSTTVKDITKFCNVQGKTENKLSMTIQSSATKKDRQACVIVSVTFDYPDVFSPELLHFESDIINQYADLPLAGLMKDEWGFPAAHNGNPHKNGFWFTRYRAEDYARRTGGRDLIRDSLLMYLGEEGQEAQQQAAINHYMEQSRLRNTEIEQIFYDQTKATFGAEAFVGTHDTVFPYPDAREFERNGLNWWTAKRDFAQSDEITPYSCRTSMAKKVGGAVWFNQWYKPEIELYQKEIWRYALAGGRMNFHILYHVPNRSYAECGKDLLRSDLIRADSRICLLNYISDAPLDCPVVVVFGHTNVMNWGGPSFDDIGTQLTDEFWRAGIYADLIPSSEIAEKALQVDENGEIWYGKQRYSAVILYHPEFENPTTAEFFQKASSGNTVLYRIGDWTRDFDGKPLDGNALLPARMQAATDVNSCAKEIIVKLVKSGIEKQTPATGNFPKWHGLGRPSVNMPATGRSRLTDGTVMLIAGENNPTGDPIQKTIQVNGYAVTFDSVGVAAIRLAKDGKVKALAAGGLKHFKTDSVEIKLDKPADIAIWQDMNGKMQGVLQGYSGPVPAALEAISSEWLRLEVPTRLVD